VIRMSLNEYPLRNVWCGPGDRRTTGVRGADRTWPNYPVWWPDVRSVSKGGDKPPRVHLPCMLPYA